MVDAKRDHAIIHSKCFCRDCLREIGFTQVDGIDGKSTMRMIVDMINAPLRQAGNGHSRGVRGDGLLTCPVHRQGKQKGGERTPPLTRPLICICNDLFAPQLRGSCRRTS
jgi:hypothetical protein